MKAFLKLVVGTILCFSWSTSAKAALISLDDPIFGPDSITHDTHTNLEWLDIPLSQGRSFADVAGEFGPGGDFEGFRYANIADLETLVLNAGISGINRRITGDFTSVTNLINLLGPTSFQAGNPETLGFLSDMPSVDSQARVVASFDFFNLREISNSNVTPVYLISGGIFANETLASPSYGSYLVRPVPEPLTILGAVTAIGFGTRFKRKLKELKSSKALKK